MPGVAARAAGWAQGHRNVPGPLGGNEALPVTYPGSLLGCQVWLALGADLTQPPETWPLTDITQWVRHADGITVKSGGQDEAPVVPPGEGRLRLDNRDFRFSRRNPNSPYYGLLNRNTPVLATVDPGSGQVPRMQMYVTEWPSRTDLGLTDVTVPIVCAGILRRLGQGSVLKSPLRRAISASTTAPWAYWPMESNHKNDTLATDTLLSPISGVGPMTQLIRGASFGKGEAGPGSGPVPDFTTGGVLTADIPNDGLFVATNGYTVEYVARYDNNVSPSLAGPGIQWFTPGGSGPTYWRTDHGTGGFGLDIRDAADVTVLFLQGGDPAPDGLGHHYRITVQQSGSDLAVTIYKDGVFVDAGLLTPGAANRPNRVTVGDGNLGEPFPDLATGIGHLTFWHGTTPPVDTTTAATGHAGEMAHERIARLCAEEGIQYTASASISPTMGAQTIDTVLANLRGCEAVDVGTLYERGFGLGYQSRTERQNATVVLEVDFAAGHLASAPDHADDDQLIRNRWTIERTGGSEATDEDADNIAANGLYDDSAELNLERDAQCAHEASWRVHVGTVDEERWPRLDFDFASAPGSTLIPTWLALEYGARLNVLNPPDMFSPDPVDAFVAGREERWDPISWNASIFTTPATPYRVYEVGSTDGNRGRVDAANSTLAGDATSLDTTISVASPGALWRTGSVNFDIECSGERMTVTNISGVASPQTFTVTRSVAKALTAMTGETPTRIRLWRPGVYAL